MKKLLLIINPVAGKRKIEKRLPEVLDIIREAGYEPELFRTAHKGEATEKVKNLTGFDRIVCAGGDGTLQEIVTGLLARGGEGAGPAGEETGCASNDPIELGYIPCGSTNDFGKSLGLSPNILKAAREACLLPAIPTDSGFFCDRIFSYVASFGAMTPASYSAPTKLKNAVGHLAYILEGARQLKTIRRYHLRVETAEGTFEDDYLMGAVANSTSMAGILRLDSSVVKFDDGLFEVLLVRYPRSFGQWAATVWGLLFKKHDGKRIFFFSTDKVKIFADPSMPWSLDGEMHEGISEGEAHILSGALRFARPKK